MKIYNVKYLAYGKPHTIRIEGARNIPDAVQTAETVLNTVYKLGADIYGVFEIYRWGDKRNEHDNIQRKMPR